VRAKATAAADASSVATRLSFSRRDPFLARSSGVPPAWVNASRAVPPVKAVMLLRLPSAEMAPLAMELALRCTGPAVRP
jgi:hypothetical protein